MNGRITAAVSGRVLSQLRRDRRTLALLLIVPCLVITLLWWIFTAVPGERFNNFGPGLIALMPFATMFVVTSVTMLRERTSGTLERLLAMRTGRADILVGYAAAFLVVCVAQTVLVIGLSAGLLDLEVHGPLWAMLLVTVASAFLGTALGLAISAFARTEFQAVQFMPAVVFPQIILCGLFVPRGEMPRAAELISHVLPLSYAVDAMTAVQQSTAAVLSAEAWANLAVVVAIAVVVLALGTFTLQRQTP